MMRLYYLGSLSSKSCTHYINVWEKDHLSIDSRTRHDSLWQVKHDRKHSGGRLCRMLAWNRKANIHPATTSLISHSASSAARL